MHSANKLSPLSLSQGSIESANFGYSSPRQEHVTSKGMRTCRDSRTALALALAAAIVLADADTFV